MHDHTLQERNPAIWSQQNRKTGTQNTFVLSVKPSVFKGCRGRAIFYFPIWWYQAPRIIETFLASCDFSGKRVVPFATSGGSGMERTEEILKKSCPTKAVFLPGRRFDSGASLAAIRNWLNALELSKK